MNQTFEQMTAEHRGFKLYGGCDPISETLLGRGYSMETNGMHRLQGP